MRRISLCALLLLATSCDAKDPPNPTTNVEPQPPEAAPPIAPAPADRTAKPTPEEPPLPFRLAPRPNTMFVSQSCLWSPGPTAAKAKANCNARKRTGFSYERRQCKCGADQILEVRKDAPLAFYVGCCWAVGDSPQEARDACEVRVRDGWCEAEDPDLVHVAVGPYTREPPFREFDGPSFKYLVPSNLGDSGWIGESGDGPCFPNGTLVELAGGSKPIEEVRPGDEVVTLRDGERVLVPVVGIKVREAEALRVFTFDADTLRLTPNHLVWLEEDWRPASEVEVGDVLEGLQGPKVVRGIAEQKGSVTVRTLRVGTPNSFFAGGVWVHNY